MSANRETASKPKEDTVKQKGQGLVEYALILVLVAVIVIGILTILGPSVGNVFSKVIAPSYCGNCICGTSICN